MPLGAKLEFNRDDETYIVDVRDINKISCCGVKIFLNAITNELLGIEHAL